MNLLDAEAPNLLRPDPPRARPVQLNFKTQTYDFEVGHSHVLGGKHILSYGGNARRNNFDITLAPERGGPQRVRRLLPGRDLLRQVPLRAGRPRGQVRQHRGPVFSPRAHRDVQARAGALAPRLLQPRVPLAVGHQQLPGPADHRQGAGPPRAGPRSAAAGSALARSLAALVVQPVPADREQRGQREPEGGIADAYESPTRAPSAGRRRWASRLHEQTRTTTSTS